MLLLCSRGLDPCGRSAWFGFSCSAEIDDSRKSGAKLNALRSLPYLSHSSAHCVWCFFTIFVFSSIIQVSLGAFDVTVAGTEGEDREQEDRLRGRAVPALLLPVRRRGLEPFPDLEGACWRSCPWCTCTLVAVGVCVDDGICPCFVRRLGATADRKYSW